MKIYNLRFYLLGFFALILFASGRFGNKEVYELYIKALTQVDTNKVENGLKVDLEKYNGFYSPAGNIDGRISSKNLPQEIINYKKNKINSIKINYLKRINNGYLLTFNIDYSGNNILVISTLNSDYSIIDYSFYLNGNGAADVKNDTIAITTFDKNSILIEIMHPNTTDEPEFSVDGIKKERLLISTDLKLIKN